MKVFWQVLYPFSSISKKNKQTNKHIFTLLRQNHVTYFSHYKNEKKHAKTKKKGKTNKQTD